MKKLLLLAFVMSYMAVAYAQTAYFCVGSGRKFHVNKECYQLKKSKTKITVTTVAKATSAGRTACMTCSAGVGAKVTSGGKSTKTSVKESNPFSTMGLELPTTSPKVKAQTIPHYAYTTCYNRSWLIPNWVAYDLTRKEARGTEPRPNTSFMPDPLVKDKSAVHSDYTNSGYSRGHMAPAADMKWSKTAMKESFYLSNVCPQRAELNGGVWERLEERCRALADDGTVYICCGPIVSSSPKHIGQNRVAVPSKFFKVLCMKRNGKWQAIGFIMPNAAIKGSMFDYAVPVDEVELLTGHDFFPKLPDYIERVVEAAWQMKDWQ